MPDLNSADWTKAYCVVYANPDLLVHPALSTFLLSYAAIPPERIFYIREDRHRSAPMQYNFGIQFILSRTKPDDIILFCDGDVQPNLGTEEFINERKFEVQCCRVDCGNDHAYSEDCNFHTAMWYTDAKTLRRVGLPAFEFPTDPLFTRNTGCACIPFYRLVRKYGISIGNHGAAGHKNRMPPGPPIVNLGRTKPNSPKRLTLDSLREKIAHEQEPVPCCELCSED